ncbi:ChbG/HpnK family deacetylase [Bartonella tamiae]|uniref:ChbG/HpnK family deacetylase n=1 Tax=Bartonella tamiae TaxID=373638 RepID=UPI00026E73D0|nr:ChbG/HpnK family deacetylase [Bartonella tamiae]EJF95048.1 hypothetical protein MEG_00629 [Bartonella tamiae Th307]
MTLHCLFHADDFALNTLCSNGIISGLSAKRLHSTSILIGGADQSNFDKLKAAEPLFIHVHLNLLEGKALTDGGADIGLTTQDGFFCLTMFQLISKLRTDFRKKHIKKWIENEFFCQIETVYKHFPSYKIRLDGHLHIHILPELRSIMINIAQKLPIDYIRIPHEYSYCNSANITNTLKGNFRRKVLSFWAKGLYRRLHSYDVKTSDYFLGSTASCHLTLKDIDRGLEKIRKKAAGRNVVVEIMTHPIGIGENNPDFYKDSHYHFAHNTKARHHELDMLLSDELISILKKNDGVLYS